MEAELKAHIAYIKSKLSSACGVIYQIRKKINPKIGKLIYYAIGYPYLNYCNLLWASCSVTIAQSLESTQKWIIRNILNENRYEPSSPLFKQLCLLKLSDITKLNSVLFVYKTIHGVTNSSVTFVPRNVDAYELRREPSLTVPFARSNQTKRFIHIRGAITWNETPIDIRNARAIITFKKKIKQFYLSTY